MKIELIKRKGNVQKKDVVFFCFTAQAFSSGFLSIVLSVLCVGICAAKDFDVPHATFDNSQSGYQKPQDSFKNPLTRYRPRISRNPAVYDYYSYPNNLNNSIYNLNDPLLRTFYPETENQPYDVSHDTNLYDSNGNSVGFLVPGGGYDVYDANGNRVGYMQGGEIYNDQGKVIGHTTQRSSGGFIMLNKKNNSSGPSR
jgi:hypothetical protein